MTDAFALLDEPRRVWLDPEALKQKFLTRAAEFHPDRAHQASEAERATAQQQYTELNAAYQRLRDPKERLQHFLELELGTRPASVQAVPAELMELFLEAARVCREAGAVAAGHARITSPLLKVQAFEQAQNWVERLRTLQRRIQAGYEDLLDQVKQLDEAWCAGTGAPERAALLARTDELARRLSFFSRWSAQVQEQMVRLSL